MILKLNRHRRWALGIAAGVCAYIAVADCVSLPLYERGIARPVTVWINSLSAALQFPAFSVVQKLGLRDGGHTTTGIWFAILLLTFILCAVAVRLAQWLYESGPTRLNEPAEGNGPASIGERDKTAAAPPEIVESPSAPWVISRRAFFGSAARVAAIAGGATAAYSFFVEPPFFGISHYRLTVRDLPPELNRLLAVQISDIHHGPTLGLDRVREMVRASNALSPDLVLLTGDYVYTSKIYIDPVIHELAKLRARIGIVAVLGNHDWWEGPSETRRAFAAAGIPMIDNDRLFVTPDRKLVRKTGEGLCVAGVGDYMEDVARADEALAQVPRAMPRLLLSHNPDAAEDALFVQVRPRVDLMICGHTHGGQIWIPGLGTPIIPSRYGQKYASGFVDGPACRVFVSKGLGTTLLPMRFCVRPEIVAFELNCA